MLGTAMRVIWTRLRPYAVAVLGVAAITAAIGAARPWVDLPNLAVAYVVFVLWLSARFGWLPAVSAAVLAFVAYDWFLVPPFGTLYISAVRDLLNLVVLVAAALVGGRLAASLAAREAGALASAQESSILSEVAIAALREPTSEAALSLLCERAVSVAGLESMTLLAADEGRVELVAGAPATEEEREEAARALAAGANLGARLRGGRLDLVRTFPAQARPVHVVLTGGVAILRPPREGLSLGSRRLLAALLGLAGLLLDRRLATIVGERARALESSDRLKAAVLSSMSHELKSPLASLRAGLTTVLMPEAGLTDDQRELLTGLDSQVTRLDRLVGDLLTMSRLEAGLPPTMAPLDVQGLVGAVLQGLGPALAAFEVVVRVPPELPSALADEVQVERVLTNLLENAAEWTRPRGRILVGAGAADGELEVWVENEGPAIPSADLEQIFDKFWTRRRGGSGLGLAICRRIVEAHGGTIRVENRADGPRFRFTLPLAPEPAAAAAAAPHPA
jgi:two-component system sensor histidine kinase KdpD